MMNILRLKDFTRRGVLLIGAFLTVALFSYALYKVTPFLSLQKKRIQEEDFRTNLLNIRRAIRQYIARNGDIQFIDPATGSKNRLDYDSSSKNISYVMEALLKEGRITYDVSGKVRFKKGGYLRQYKGSILNTRNLQVTENLIDNSSFENVYIDDDTDKILVDGWDSNDGYGRAVITMSSESPSGKRAEAYREGSYGTKTVVIEKFRH